MSTFALECAGATHVGRRDNNEDALFGSPRMAAVADGVGGAAAGEVASATIINALVALDKRRLADPLEDELPRAIEAGNDTVRFVGTCRPELAGMGTTLTAVALSNDGRYLIANVGDSRTYLYRGGRLSRLTRDDSLVQALIERGKLSPQEARHHPQRSVVLEALDGRPQPAVTTRECVAQAGDRLLLCSDGLSDVLGDDEIAGALAHEQREVAAQGLIELALAGGGSDNITVIVADVVRANDGRLGWLPAFEPTR